MTQLSSRIIFHIDGDAFFASCEQATALYLRNKPIVVGKERGIVIAYSYEAKRLGVKRGMTTTELRKRFGQQVLLISSDYRKYSLFSKRMKRIVATYTMQIEDTSIDECYADMTEVVSTWDRAEKLAQTIQAEIHTKLGITVSMGIGPNKSIAKIASSLNKPQGLTLVKPETIKPRLYALPIGKVSGIGNRSESIMNSRGIHTIGDLVNKELGWIMDNLHKPAQELYRELCGECIKHLEISKNLPGSISRIRAFRPATGNREVLLSEFAHHAEVVAAQLYAHNLQSSAITMGLKIPMQGCRSVDIRPERPLTSAPEIISLLCDYLDVLLRAHETYRATYIVLRSLTVRDLQLSLFSQTSVVIERMRRLDDVAACMRRRFGPGLLATASSMRARKRTDTHDVCTCDHRTGTPLMMSSDRQRIMYLPYLGEFA